MRRYLMAGSLAGTVCAAGVLAGAPDRETPKDGPQPVLVVQNAGLDAWFDDDRDRAFGEALKMLPRRVRELPHEFPDTPPELAGLLDLGLQVAASPSYLSMTYNPDNPAGGAFGYGLALSVDTGTRQRASELHAAIGAMIAMSGAEFDVQPSDRFEGMSQFSVQNAAAVNYGPRQSDGTWSYDVLVGSVDDPEAGLSSLAEAPARGFEPMLRARFDAKGLEGVIWAAQQFAPQEQREMVQMGLGQLGAYGLAGDSPISVDVQWGRTSDEMLGVTVVHNARQVRERWYVSETPLGRADFRAVPDDATMAWLAKVDWSLIDDMIQQMGHFADRVNEPLDRFRAMTGVDLIHDVFGSFGDTMALYTADSTGGGGLFSGTLLLSVSDNERLANALSNLVAFGNAMAQEIEDRPGAVRLSSWTQDGIDLVSVRVPGLPMPLEVTYALVDGWFVVAPSPQGALAAARQALGKSGDGLWANKGFANAVSRDREYISVSFVDGPANARAGYWMTSMFGSAVANMVRSTIDIERDPGMIVPTYDELVGDARAEVQVSYWDGDSLVTRSSSDRSLLAGATVGMGSFVRFVPVFMVPAAMQRGRNFGMLDAPVVREIASRIGPWAPLTPGQRTALAMLAAGPELDMGLPVLEAGAR